MDALRRKRFLLAKKSCTHCFFHLLVISKLVSSLSIPEWTKCVIIWRGRLMTVCRMLQPPEVHLVVGVDGNAWLGIVMRQCNTLHYHLFAFYSDGWFWLVLACFIVIEVSAVSLCHTLLVNFWLLLVDQHLSPVTLCRWKCTTDFCSWHTSGQKNIII